jgi:hypothetical protein
MQSAVALARKEVKDITQCSCAGFIKLCVFASCAGYVREFLVLNVKYFGKRAASSTHFSGFIIVMTAFDTFKIYVAHCFDFLWRMRFATTPHLF